MPKDFSVFSLADVAAKAQAYNMGRQTEEFNQAKMAEYQRALQENQSLGDIYARSIETTPGTRERISPEMGMVDEQNQPYTLVSDESPSRTDMNWDKAIGMTANLPEHLRGPAIMKLHQARAIEEDRKAKLQMEMMKAMQEHAGRGPSDNDLVIVASGGVSGNPIVDKLGKQGAIDALSRKTLVIPEGAMVGNKGYPTDPSSIPNKKTLSRTDLEDLREASINYDSVKNLASTFKPEFAGKGLDIFSNTSNFIVSRGNDPLGRAQANWARKYEALNNIQRHKFFGSALTPTEVDSWKRSIASLSQGSGNLKEHLANLEQMAKKVLNYTAKPKMIENYHQGQVRAAIGDKTYDEIMNFDASQNITSPTNGNIVRWIRGPDGKPVKSQ